MSGGYRCRSEGVRRLQVRKQQLYRRALLDVWAGILPYSAELRIRVQATGLATYADASVVCDPVFETRLRPRMS